MLETMTSNGRLPIYIFRGQHNFTSKFAFRKVFILVVNIVLSVNTLNCILYKIGLQN